MTNPEPSDTPTTPAADTGKNRAGTVRSIFSDVRTSRVFGALDVVLGVALTWSFYPYRGSVWEAIVGPLLVVCGVLYLLPENSRYPRTHQALRAWVNWSVIAMLVAALIIGNTDGYWVSLVVNSLVGAVIGFGFGLSIADFAAERRVNTARAEDGEYIFVDGAVETIKDGSEDGIMRIDAAYEPVPEDASQVDFGQESIDVLVTETNIVDAEVVELDDPSAELAKDRGDDD